MKTLSLASISEGPIRYYFDPFLFIGNISLTVAILFAGVMEVRETHFIHISNSHSNFIFIKFNHNLIIKQHIQYQVTRFQFSTTLSLRKLYRTYKQTKINQNNIKPQ